jgi:hypothetical protein
MLQQFGQIIFRAQLLSLFVFRFPLHMLFSQHVSVHVH